MTESYENCKNLVCINDISVSEDKKFVMVSLDEGIKVYQKDPLKVLNRVSPCQSGCVKTAVQLANTDVGVFVTKSGSDRYVQHRANIYNFKTGIIGATITAPSKILRVLITKEKLILVTKDKVLTYNIEVAPLKNIKKSVTYASGSNPLGLCDIATSNNTTLMMCFPATEVGSVQLVDVGFNGLSQRANSVNKAHNHPIRCMKFSSSGIYLATASEHGTLIRLWSTATNSLISEFRRGMDKTLLYDMDFSGDDQYLCCIGEKGTGHIYVIKDSVKTAGSFWSNDESKNAMTFTVKDIVDCKLCVNMDNTVNVFTKDGRSYKFLISRSSNCKTFGCELFNDLDFDDEKFGAFCDNSIEPTD